MTSIERTAYPRFKRLITDTVVDAELESIREQQQAIVEVLIGNYRTVLQHIDADSPVQAAREKAAVMTAEILSAVGELDQDTKADSVAARLGEGLGPALHTMVQALRVQAGALGVPVGAVDYFGGFAGQYEQIEKVAAHHGNYWEVLLYGHLLKDRSTMYDLTSRLELRATSEDNRVLDALAHACRYKTSRDYIPERHEDGRPVDISFATLNWQKAVRDKNRPGVFVRKHFEAMVFAALAEELRTGDVAVAGSEEYADWSEQLLPWEDVEAKLGDYLVEVGLAAPGDETPYDAVAFRRQLEDKLTAAAAAADAGYPDNEGGHRLGDRYPLAQGVPLDISQAWGDGSAVAADGTRMDTYLSVRYGKPGGIAYHHISDTYIALFTHFIPVWGVGGRLHHRGPAQEHLRAEADHRVRHLMRVAVSVREGAISSTLLLRRLRAGSRKNATYTAIREVGRVVRTVQLLRYLSDAPLRRRVTAATNKVEAFNGFSQWIGFGNGGVITDNDPVEQEKTVKFNALLTNELGIQPEAYDPHLDVDFSPLRGNDAPAPDGYGQAA